MRLRVVHVRSGMVGQRRAGARNAGVERGLPGSPPVHGVGRGQRRGRGRGGGGAGRAVGTENLLRVQRRYSRGPARGVWRRVAPVAQKVSLDGWVGRSVHSQCILKLSHVKIRSFTVHLKAVSSQGYAIHILCLMSSLDHSQRILKLCRVKIRSFTTHLEAVSSQD